MHLPETECGWNLGLHLFLLEKNYESLVMGVKMELLQWEDLPAVKESFKMIISFLSPAF